MSGLKPNLIVMMAFKLFFLKKLSNYLIRENV